MAIRMGAREARANFSELLGKVHYGKHVVIVERSGKPMAAMIPIEVYEREVAASQGEERPAEVSPQEVSEDQKAGQKLVDPAAMLPLIVERIVRGFQPERIILFGSHARGVAGPYSDLDLLVVLPHVADKRKAAVEIRRALADLTVPSDIIVTTPEEIARRGHLVGDVLRPALREGKVVYERSQPLP